METTTEYTIEDVKRDAGKEVAKREHSERMQLIIFKLGSEEYGLSIEQIKEVVLTPRIAKMPQTPEHIKGVANIRGNIIAIMDLEQKFGLMKSGSLENNNNSNYTLVVESEEYKVGVLVKEVPNTLSINVSDIDTASNFVQYTSLDTNSVIGVVKSGERMIILIDMIKLIEAENLKETLTK
ncbi:MAG: chemotaxis protein CheW [Sphingobacteriaceae bacterium]|nr:chemotaxis protein CheW [Sphingobacteriaceae bacterium]